ncbi:MAG TPA: hypothetical protein DIW17_15745 [Clostridiales bacterium]|nr:hypothetical protein [Clostridiales bacterium]
MSLPKAVEYVIRTIMDSGGQAYLVGGALRDHLLGRPVIDYDIAVSLLPDEVTALFSNHKSWPTGKRFGTITVKVDKMNMEITTFRQESLYSDARHPDDVSFVSDINLDLSRRDFTINAMAWNPFQSSALIDPFHGRKDLRRKIIRTVGSPYERFAEDPLRIMRGIRFSAQLDFKIDEETKKAMAACSEKLRKVSAERTQDELNKLLLSPHPDKGLLQLEVSVVLSILFPPGKGLQRNALTSQSRDKLQLVKHLTMHLPLRLAGLTSLLYDGDYTKPEIIDSLKSILSLLKYDKKTIAYVLKLLYGYSNFLSMKISPYTMRKLIGQLGVEDTMNILSWIDITNQLNGSMVDVDELSEKLNKAYIILSNVQKNNDPVFFEQLAVKGNDVLKAGIGKKDPKLVGEALELAYQWILENPELNNTDCLLAMLTKHYKKISDTVQH